MVNTYAIIVGSNQRKLKTFLRAKHPSLNRTLFNKDALYQ